MLSKEIQNALNEQINKEMYSAYMYLSMAGFFAEKNLNGFSHWMRLQFSEELVHAGKLFDYVIDRDGKVDLKAIAAPPESWSSILNACEAAYDAEVENTAQINEIMDLGMRQPDHATRVMLQWFIEEQVEEESSALNLVEQVKLAGDNPSALLILDRDMAARTAGEASK